MPILTTVINQKTHIIYGIVIVLIASVAYHFFKKDPEKIVTTLTKVETKIQQVEKIVTKDRIVYKDRTITTHKKNGDVIVEVDHEHSDTKVASNTQSKTQSQTVVQKTVVESFMKNYSIEAMFPISIKDIGYPNPMDTQVSVGMRVFSLPVFAVVGTTPKLNSVLVGLRLEF